MSTPSMARVVGYRGSVALLPARLYSAAGLKKREALEFAFGKTKRRVIVRPGTSEEWRLPYALLRDLGLPGGRWMYRLEDNGVLRLAPLMGILTTWQMTPYFHTIMRVAARKGMMVMVFRPGGQRSFGGKLEAWGMVAGRIRRMNLPWPNVVYNRIPNRGGELLAGSRHCRRTLRQAGIPVFNHRFFHKWRIHRLLRNDEEARRFLPHTEPLVNMRQVWGLVQRHRAVYLKPNGGSKGLGIVKVSRLHRSGYQVSYRRGALNHKQLCSNWSMTSAYIRQAMQQRTYVVQEAVELAKYLGRPFDIRVTLYKDGTGSWVPCGAVAKVAGAGSITTHVANGGRVIPLKRALRHVFGEKSDEVAISVQAAAVALALAVERVTQLELGELGLDLGLTSQGEVKMFEANSKPGRAVFRSVWNRGERLKSISHLCDYAARLAGFGGE